MAPFVLAYLAGVLTVATPCILPILPFVLARSDRPFHRGGLPLLVGLALAFAAAASLASVAGGWAVAASSYGRTAALALMALAGLAMLLPRLAERLARPVAALGSGLSVRAEGTGIASSVLLGVATGLVWTPCAGPVLGLILAGAALRGPGIETFFLLLSYAAGAATALALGMAYGRRLLSGLGEPVRRMLGGAVLAGVAVIALGLDTSLLVRLPVAGIDFVEQRLVATAQAESPALPGPLGSLLQGRQWINTAPLRAQDLRGKVVLVNFWTYSCINCLRALPHVRAWAEAYRDRGLVVVGVHTPEFAFEKDFANVAGAAASLGVGYPVVLDNDFAIWRGFANQGWPAVYLVDAEGRVRHRVLGEGGYAETERLIRAALDEAGAPVADGKAEVDANGVQAAADPADLGSAETYVGHAQGTGFASPDGLYPDQPYLYRQSDGLQRGRWSLGGTWTVGGEFATLDGAPGSIRYRFHARDLHLVLARADRPVRFRVTVDGAPPGADHGADVDAEGWGTVREARLYQLVRQAGPVADRTFEIEFLDPGVRAYAFTFG